MIDFKKLEQDQARMRQLEDALKAVRSDIMATAPFVLFREKGLSETTVDYICGVLGDDWDHDTEYAKKGDTRAADSAKNADLRDRLAVILSAYAFDADDCTILTVRDAKLTTADLAKLLRLLM